MSEDIQKILSALTNTGLTPCDINPRILHNEHENPQYSASYFFECLIYEGTKIFQIDIFVTQKKDFEFGFQKIPLPDPLPFNVYAEVVKIESKLHGCIRNFLVGMGDIGDGMDAR